MVTRSCKTVRPSSPVWLRPGRAACAAIVGLSLVGAGCGGGDDDPKKPGVNVETALPADAIAGKFCNLLTNADGSSFELTLEIGNPPVKLTAASGKCSTDAGKVCKALPSGRVIWALFEAGQMLGLGALQLEKGQKWLFLASLNQAMAAGLQGGQIKPEFTCEAVDPFALGPAPDGGTPPPTLPPGRAAPAPSTLSPMTLFNSPERFRAFDRNLP